MTSSVGTEGQTGGQPLGQQAEFLAEKMAEVRGEISKAIVGQAEVVEGVLIALLAGGHVLLEGAPGLGKTMLVRTLAQAVALKYSRIQFTPDLMPADVIGTSVVQENGDGRKSLGFQPGPIFTNLLLADEINRATPKTQSALLEAMQEKQVTVAHTSHLLEEPFFVMATQNPLEMEGTYPLPEAQLDRFLFKLRVPYPGREDLHDILDRTTQGSAAVVSPVVNGAQILEMRKVVRTVPVAPHVQEIRGETDAGHASRKSRKSSGQQVHPLRKFAARRADADPRRESARAARRPLQREHGRHSRADAARIAPPHHPEFRGPGGWPDARRFARRDRRQSFCGVSGAVFRRPGLDFCHSTI